MALEREFAARDTPEMMAPIEASRERLVQLRDRIGLQSDEEAHETLQRLTWIWRTLEAVMLINRAIDDIEEAKRDGTIR